VGYGATLTLSGSGPTSEGAISMNRAAYNCDDTIQIVLEDLDLVGIGCQQVTIESTTETTPETVLLQEIEDGRFEGSILTDTNAPAADGKLQVSPGDTITLTYEDDNYGGAGPMTVTEQAAVDCTGPMISNVTITEVTESSFIVEWDTDEASNTVVMYGDTVGLGYMVEDTELTTTHSIMVSGLEDCTYYYFEVHSTDWAGNEAVDDNGGAYYMALTLELITMLDANMDTDPGWSYEGQWAWGIPQGNSGDPSSGYTGDNVVGYNLAGSYPNNLAQTHCTTTAFDCSAASQVYLSFWKWLGIESSTWDHASISVSGNNGSTWTQIWDHTGGSTAPSSWTFEEFDISAVAAGQSQVKVRWTMGTTDSSVVYCGWNIDDVLVSYTQPCQAATPTPSCNNDGDVNLDGTITAGDAQMAFMIALGSYSPTWEEECAADCNGDETITAGDAQQVFMTALGSGTCVDPM